MRQGVCFVVLVFSVQWALADGLRCIAQDYLSELATSEDGVRDISVVGDRAYIADRSGGMVIADVSDVGAPVILGAFTGMSFALNVAVEGDYAYVGGLGEGMYILDISDPTLPMLVGRYDQGLDVFDIELDTVAGVAYLACNTDGVRVLDIHDLAAPFELARLESDGQSFGIATSGERLYVPFWGGGFRVYDISDPATPVEMSAVENNSPYFSISIEGDTACVLNRFGFAEIYNLASGITPELVSKAYFSPSLPYDIQVQDQRLYVADRDSGVWVFDILNPEKPELLFTYPIDGFCYGFDVRDGTAFVGNNSPGMQVIDMSDPRAPLLNGPLPLTDIRSIEYHDGYLYAWDANQLRVMKVLGDGVLEETGQATSGITGFSTRNSMWVDGDRLYMSHSNTRDVSVHNITDPAAPTLLGVSRSESAVGGMLAVDGGIAYHAGGSLEIRDLSDPVVGKTLSLTPLDAFATGGDLDGSILYLGLSGQGLRIFDVQDPSAPVLLGGLVQGEADFRKMVVVDGIAYCIGLEGVLSVLDVSDPTEPKLLGSVDGFGQLYAISVFGDFLFMSGNGAGQTIVDISDPTNPMPLIEANEWGTVSSVAVVDEIAYFGSFSGLVAYNLSGCNTCPADLNGDGSLNFFDVSAFLVAYLVGDALGDWNGDGVWDFFDVSGFLTDYQAGCP